MKRLKKGSGELIAFTAITPSIMMIIALMVSIIQIATFKEKLEYATYVAARAAAVSPSLETAEENAKKAAELNLGSVGNSYDKSTLQTTIKVIEGEPPETASSNVAVSEENEATGWTKGNYIECEVSARAKPVFKILTGAASVKKCKITMLIEISE